MYWHGIWEEILLCRRVFWVELIYGQQAITDFIQQNSSLPLGAKFPFVYLCLPSLNSGYYLSVCRVALMTSCAFKKVRFCDSFHMILEHIKCVWSGIKKRMIQRVHKLPCICSSWCSSPDTLHTFCRDDLCHNLYAINFTVRLMKKILGMWLTANGRL